MSEHDDYYDDEELPSKSQLKRDSHALQDLGEALVELPAAQLAKMPLWEELREAVNLARRISQRGGRKRQLKYIGKLLRSGDPEPIREALAALEQTSAEETARHHLAERWRTRLLEEGDPALAEFLDQYPDVDRQQLRQLVRNAQSEQARGKPPRFFRELFRLVREAVRREE